MIAAAVVFAYFAVLILVAEAFHLAMRRVRRKQAMRQLVRRRIVMVEANRLQRERVEELSLWRQRRAPLRPYDYSKDGV